MTTMPRDVARKQTANPPEIQGTFEEAASSTFPQVNPHTAPTAITGLGLLAALIAFGYAAHTQPAHLNLSAAAVLAAILVFLFNLGRHHAHEERQR